MELAHLIYHVILNVNTAYQDLIGILKLVIVSFALSHIVMLALIQQLVFNATKDFICRNWSHPVIVRNVYNLVKYVSTKLIVKPVQLVTISLQI